GVSGPRIGSSVWMSAPRQTPGDGRALHLPIPSAAWRPTFAAELLPSQEAVSSAGWAHGFAPPSRDGFALSRMKGVMIRAGREGLPPEAATKNWHPRLLVQI